jgi:hypothetical protein
MRRSLSTLILRHALAATCIVVVLSACAGTPGATPVPTAPTISASPPEPAASDTDIVIYADHVEVVTDNVAVASFDYYEDPAVAIASLQDAFGAAPTETAYPGAIESLPGTDYEWDGFVLRSQPHDPSPGWPTLSVRSTSPTSLEFDVRTAGGVSVGDSPADVEAVQVTDMDDYEHDGSQRRRYTIETLDVPDIDDGPDAGVDLTTSVGVDVDLDTQMVELVLAPSLNYGV